MVETMSDPLISGNSYEQFLILSKDRFPLIAKGCYPVSKLNITTPTDHKSLLYNYVFVCGTPIH